MRMKFGAMGLGVLMLSMAAAPAMCQQKEVHVYRNPWSGDTPENPGPLAKKLSPKLKAKDIAKAMRKVGDWELTQATPHFMPDWTEAVLYRGYMAAAKSLPDAEYRKAMLDMANKTDWKMGVRETVADDQAVAYTYLDFYRQEHDAKMLAPTKATLDKVMPLPDLCVETCPKWGGKDMPMWWWADSLYMAAPVWAEMYAVTGDKAYLDHMDKLWWTTSKLLYDTDEHLYSRDASFLNKHEANGK